MWTLCNREALERYVVQAFPNGEWLAYFVVEKFQTDIRILQHDWSNNKSFGKELAWQYGKVIVRFRLLSGLRMVEVLSVGAEQIAGQTWGRVDIFLVTVLVIIFGALVVMTVML
jgi:hypothetical protein